MQKQPLLSEQPSGSVKTLAELVGLANAIEQEAVDRYSLLAETMEKRGEHETAATFRGMCELERKHIERVEHWASRLGESVPLARDFRWLLPHDIAASWEEAQNSTLLTPYRALAIAVTNEERAFALYAYISAQAAETEVARQAEVMAREELAHAAELRIRRRAAYRREHPGGAREVTARVETLAEFTALRQRLEAEAVSIHRAVAELLDRAGDPASAKLLTALSEREGKIILGGRVIEPANVEGLPRSASPDALLRVALKPLEQMSEIYEDLFSHAPGDEMLAAEQKALSSAVERIALIGARIEELSRAA